MTGKKRPAYLVAGLVLFSSLAASSKLESDGARVRDYALDVEFFPDQARMSATADISFEPGTVTGDTLEFFLHGELHVDSIWMDGRRVEPVQESVLHRDDYSYVANRVTVGVDGDSLVGTLRVAYSGFFNPSVATARSNYMRIDRDGVFLRSLGYSLWFPVFVTTWRDSYDVSFSRVTIRTPSEFRSVFAGELVGEHEQGGSWVTQWTAPRLSTFDAQCTARPYDLKIDGGFRVYHLRDSTAAQMASEILAFSQHLKAIYQAHYWHRATAEQRFVLQMPQYGDISSGNVIGISDDTWNTFDVTAWQSLTVAHELVHSFVQVPRSAEMGSFVIEGFPSYLHLPAMAEILGEQWYRDYMKSVEEGYLMRRETGMGRRGDILPPEKPILEIRTDEISEYKDRFVLNDRVRLFFDYLRRELGGTEFFQLTSDLLNHDMLDYETLVADVEARLPGSSAAVYRWLRTTEFPAEFHIDQD